MSFVFNAKSTARGTEVVDRQRLTSDALRELRSPLENSGLHSEESAAAERSLQELRETYEYYSIILSRHLRLALPDWLPPREAEEDWRLALTRVH